MYYIWVEFVHIFGSSLGRVWVEFGILGRVFHMWIEFGSSLSSLGRDFHIVVDILHLGRIFNIWVEFRLSYSYLDRIFHIWVEFWVVFFNSGSRFLILSQIFHILGSHLGSNIFHIWGRTFKFESSCQMWGRVFSWSEFWDKSLCLGRV